MSLKEQLMRIKIQLDGINSKRFRNLGMGRMFVQKEKMQKLV